jgi:hypothetical protein
MFTVNVSGVAETNSPLPLSNALLKWYGTAPSARWMPVCKLPVAIVVVRLVVLTGEAAVEDNRALLDASGARGAGRSRPEMRAVVLAACTRKTMGSRRARGIRVRDVRSDVRAPMYRPLAHFFEASDNFRFS